MHITISMAIGSKVSWSDQWLTWLNFMLERRPRVQAPGHGSFSPNATFLKVRSY